MAKPKLPEPVREQIKDLFRQGYSNQSVFRFVKDEAKSYVSSDQELSRCIRSVKGRVKRYEGIGVRPTQLTIRKPALQKFRPGYDLFQNLHEC